MDRWRPGAFLWALLANVVLLAVLLVSLIVEAAPVSVLDVRW